MLGGPIPGMGKGASSATAQKKRPSLAIEKSWQAIHFVLHGDPWKGTGLLNNAVLGGKEVGEDMGYGPARYLDPFTTVQTSTALDRLTDAEFQKRARAANFDAADIYAYSSDMDLDELDELLDYFREIRAFFRAAADKGHGILLGII